jgi:hydrogenase maturation protease
LIKGGALEMKNSSSRILVFGYGNPGRQDDALGIDLTCEIERWSKKKGLKNISFEQNYQLNIEDAEKISNFDRVIFVDASINDIGPFSFEEVKPDLKTEFTMHAVSPSFVLGLCQQIFNKHPETFQLQIKGFSWEFMEQSSANARKNLKEAVEFLKVYFTEQNYMCELT